LRFELAASRGREHVAFGKFAVAAASAIVVLSLPAVVSAQSPQIQQVLRYCKPDAERLCPGISPGGGRIVRCLKEHKMEISVGCAKTLQGIKARMGG
jgi:hypothetical protein